jgi:hypothetical protein
LSRFSTTRKASRPWCARSHSFASTARPSSRCPKRYGRSGQFAGSHDLPNVPVAADRVFAEPYSDTTGYQAIEAMQPALRSANPREIKRYVNLFRFYWFITFRASASTAAPRTTRNSPTSPSSRNSRTPPTMGTRPAKAPSTTRLPHLRRHHNSPSRPENLSRQWPEHRPGRAWTAMTTNRTVPPSTPLSRDHRGVADQHAQLDQLLVVERSRQRCNLLNADVDGPVERESS